MKYFEELTDKQKLELMARNASKHRNRPNFKVRETSTGIITIVKPKKHDYKSKLTQEFKDELHDIWTENRNTI